MDHRDWTRRGERSMSRRDQREQGALIYGGIPRAHLMPPEVAERRKELRRRRRLIAATVVVIAITLGGVLGSYWYAAGAEARLADERRTTEQLLATQLEYSEVIQVQNELSSISGLRASLGAVEVLWDSALDPYLAVFSSDEVVESLAFRGGSPTEPSIGTAGPLRQPRVAAVTFTVVTATPPAPWGWLRAWEGLETFADASIDQITLLGEGYQTIVTVNLNSQVLSQRFVEEGSSQ